MTERKTHRTQKCKKASERKKSARKKINLQRKQKQNEANAERKTESGLEYHLKKTTSVRKK